MKVHSLKPGCRANSTETTLEQFTDELRELSTRCGFKLMSVGAMQAFIGGEDSCVIAIWKLPDHAPSGI